MMIWLLTVVAGLSGDPALRQREAATELLNRFAVMPKRVAGRVLGLLIGEGMTEGQLLQILGKPDLISGGGAGGLSFDWFKYLDYGLTISLSTGKTGVLQVDRITYWSLSDPYR